MKMNRKVLLGEPVKDTKIGYPFTPGRWVSELQTNTVMRVRMTCGGGMGGSSWYEHIRIPACGELALGDRLAGYTTWDGHKKFLNGRYIVTAEPAKIVTAKFENLGNKNFPAGVTEYCFLGKIDEDYELADEFLRQNW